MQHKFYDTIEHHKYYDLAKAILDKIDDDGSGNDFILTWDDEWYELYDARERRHYKNEHCINKLAQFIEDGIVI